MALNKTQILNLYNSLSTTDKQTLIDACAAVVGTDRPEDAASCVLLVLEKLSQ